MKPLETISYNIEFGKKFDDIISWITNHDILPDIFCLQEFPEDKLIFMKQFFLERGYNCFFALGTELYGIQVGQLTAHKKNTLQLLKSEEIALGNHHWEKRYVNIKGDRSALLTTYSYKGRKIQVVNLHLSVLAPNAMRYEQLKTITKALPLTADNVIIMGDFNHSSLLGVKSLLKLMGKYGFSCIDRQLVTHKIFGIIPQQLDYVFQKGFVPQEIKVLHVPHSDHFPVYTKLALPE